MPVMNGIDATKMIRQVESEQSSKKATPIIGLSANTRKEYVDAAISAGMNCYITKPFIKSDIYTAMENLLKR